MAFGNFGLALTDGVAHLDLPGGEQRVTIDSPTPVLARIESRYLRPVQPASDSQVVARIEGEVGSTGGRSALEIVVENRADQSIAHPVVELGLPSAAAFDAVARGSAASGQVRRVSGPDAFGSVRVELHALGPHETGRIPLSLPWIASGTVRGLSLAAYDADAPWRVSFTPERAITLPERPL